MAEPLLPPVSAPPEPNIQNQANEQTTIPEWLKGIDDPELQGSKFLHRFADVKTLAQNALASKQTLSKKLVDIPGADSPPEKWEELHTALGRPAKPEDYKVTLTGEDGKPFEIKNPELDGLIRNIAHSIGTNNEGYNNIIAKIAEHVSNLPNIYGETIQGEWKGDFEKNRQIADKAFNSLSEGLQTEIRQTFGPHPIVMKMLYEIGKRTINDTIPDAAAKTQPVQTEGDLQKRHDALRNDPAFLNRNDPRFKDVNDELVAITEKLYKMRGGK